MYIQGVSNGAVNHHGWTQGSGWAKYSISLVTVIGSAHDPNRIRVPSRNLIYGTGKHCLPSGSGVIKVWAWRPS